MLDLARRMASGFGALRVAAGLSREVFRKRAGALDVERLVSVGSALFEGQDAEQTYVRAVANAEALMDNQGPQRVDWLGMLREHVREVVVFSLAPQVVLESILSRLDVTIYGTEVHIDEGLLTRAPVYPIPYGEGKLVLAERYLHAGGLSFNKAAFYGTGSSDARLLERVRYPMCINPSKNLQVIATNRSWPMHDWHPT